MKELAGVLTAFHEATECAAAVWTQSEPGAPLLLLGAAPGAAAPPDPQTLTGGSAAQLVEGPGGPSLVAVVPGPRRAWLRVGPCAAPGHSLERLLRLLRPVVSQFLQSSLEVEHAATELAERYEEINLLYTTSEILGRTVTLEEATAKILNEISDTVGARRGAILVHDRVTDTLQVAAAIGMAAVDAPPIAKDDPTSLAARVFRTQHPLLVDGNEPPPEAEGGYRRGATLCVPIIWTTLDGGDPLGVVVLSARHGEQPFTAGDQKLVAAIATQIGTAIQNARLVRLSLAQERFQNEMQMAHDLQMKLLPNPRVVEPDAEVAARVVPAESVGGDFYHLFRLGGGRTGVMIGDVSSHGYRAALIMALAMSASAIHAQTTASPAQTLSALLNSLRDELLTTEMFISAFYGVIDPGERVLRYANTGHPHAFVLGADGAVQRLPAIDPPLGLAEEPPREGTRPWAPGSDLLLLFTDGISDARNRVDQRLGEQPVLDLAVRHRAKPVSQIVARIFEAVDLHTGGVTLRDDQTLVLARS